MYPLQDNLIFLVYTVVAEKKHSSIFCKYLTKGYSPKKNSIFKDIIQIEVDLPPSHAIFDKFIFDKVLIMFTSLPPLEFLTKIKKFQALKLTFSIIPITF